jgi:gliding motility-associated-like protein
MRLNLLKQLVAISCFLFLSGTLKAQSCIPTNIGGTTINLLCNQVCSTLVFQIPHIKGTGDYVVSSVPYNPFPYVTGAPPLTLPCANQDDKYFDVTPLPFPFCFYDSIFNSLVVSTNGSVTFDLTNALKGSNWSLNAGIVLPFEGTGTQGTAGTCPTPSGVRLPKAGIFGAFCDIFPQTGTGYKIESREEGFAPCRKFVISFSQVQMFGCSSVRMTSQIVLHESTGLIDVFIEDKPPCNSNGGLAIVGIQNYVLGTPDQKAVTAPGRGANNGAWSTTNEAWRFTPSGPGSRYVISELLDMTATVVATGDTITTTPGLLDISFLNFCTPPGSNQFVVRTRFSACNDPLVQLISLDTITINRTNSLGATASTTNASCGPPNGTITITVPPGVGTSPYTYILDGGAPVIAPSPYTFMNVANGTHTIVVTDASAGCTSTINVTVNLVGTIPATTTATPTACAGVNDGSITITSAGGSGPYIFFLDGGAPVAGTIPFTFSNLSAGVHTILVTDQTLGCSSVLMNVNVPVGIGITGVITTLPTSCPAATNGSITATALSGVPPFLWQLDGGATVPGASPYTFINVSAGAHNVRIFDNLGCVAGFNANVSAGPGNTGIATTTATSCTGVSNGTITATALTGTAPFTWQLDGGAPVAGSSPYTFINVSAGVHLVTIIDNLGCSALLTPLVDAGPGINGSTNSTATSCPAASNGSITATALSGTAPFTWQLDGGPIVPGASPYTFINVAAGLHTITITDNSGCNVLLTETVTAGTAMNITTTFTQAACLNATNGTITVTSATGTGPYTFSLDGGAPVPGTIPFTFTNLPAMAHTVVVNDLSTGCNSSPVVVNIGASYIANFTTVIFPATCPGSSDGRIVTTVVTGTGPFTWSLDGGPFVPGPSPITFNNLLPGPHTVALNDVFNCNVSYPFFVDANIPTSTIASTATACTGASTGTITVFIVSTAGPYTFSLDGGAPVPGTLPFTFINVSAGSHTVVVNSTSSGCSTTPNSVIVATGPGVTGNATSTATSCPAATNGTVTADATTGTAPFTYSLDGGAPQSGANPYTFNGVAAGPHTVIITDNFGCTVTLNVNVTAGPPLNANANAAATSCSGASNGTITVTPTSGTAPYLYSLDGGAPVPGGVSYTFINVTAGAHTVTVTDVLGCITNPIPVTVNAGPPLTTTVSTSDVLCNGGATGVITVAVPLIGTPPYQYSLDNVIWQASNVFNGLAAGNYTVYYRESNGCQGSQPVTVNEPAGMTTSASTIAAVCNGQNNGTITVTAGGGVTPYDYSINAGASWQASNVFTVAAGTYTITIRDANGCTKTQAATVTEPAALAAASVNGNASCDGGNDGVITVSVLGGNLPYTYSLDGVNFQASNVFNVAPGPYTVTVKDNLSCNTTFNTVVGLTNNLTFTPQTNPTICEGTSTQLQLVSNATVYSWTPSLGLNNTTIPNPIANPIVTTQYTVTATLGRCSANNIVIVNVNPAPLPDAGPPGFICYGQTYQLQGSGGVQFTWTPSTYLSSTNISNPVSTPLKNITYTLSEVIDALGCKSLTTDQVTVDVTPPIKVKTFPYDTIGYPGDQFRLNATSIAPFYTWTPTIGLSDPNIANPVLTVGSIGSDIFYKVTAYTAAGCKGEGFVNLKVYKGPELYIPTAFTPNGDGLNDLFYPLPVGIKSINYFRVFNRWGQLLFSSTTLYKGWDGKLQGVEQPSAAYVFMAQGVDKNGKLLTRKGTVTLIR